MGQMSFNSTDEEWDALVEKSKLHKCKYCGVETRQPDEECYAKPKQHKIMKKKIVYSEKYNKGTFIEKQEILKFLQSSIVLSPEILEAIRYNDDSESYIIKINIPKEEQCTCKKHDPYCCHIHGSCPTCVKKEEPNQETLEEAFSNYVNEKYHSPTQGSTPDLESAKFGAKWQQERMYSEEEVLEIILYAINSCTDGISCSKHFFEQWFEQFKKK